jgi:hypothetical protein
MPVARARPGYQPGRRALVLAIGALTALLASAMPLHGFGILVVVALAGLDILLLQATGGLAFRGASGLDERQRRLRDFAYRRGFRWIGLAVVLLYVVWLGTDFAVTITSSFSIPAFSAVDIGIPGRVVLAMTEVLLMVPTCVVAWREDGGGGGMDAAEDGSGRDRRRAWMAWLVLPGLVFAWLAAVVWLPPQSAPHGSFSSTSGGGSSGLACQEFAGGTMVGAEFGATLGLGADVCWDGTVAYVVGDPSLPIPASAIHDYAVPGFTPPPNEVNPAQPLSGCGWDTTADFAAVSRTRCGERIDANGTLHYTVSAQVSPLPFGIASREVSIHLVVTRTGKVLEGQGFEQP